MNNKVEFDFLKIQPLMKGFSDSQILLFQDHFVEEKFVPNTTIIEEGESSSDIYIIAEGEVSVLKWDEHNCTEVLIAKIGKGEIFGEMSFLDDSFRSSTIKVDKPTTVLKLSKKALSTIDDKDILAQIHANVAMVNIQRLRDLNKLYVKSSQNDQGILKNQQLMAKFVIYQYLILGISTLASLYFNAWMQPYLPWLIAIIPSLLMIKTYGFEWRNFGLNLQNWVSTSLVSLFFVAIILILLCFYNYLLKYYMEDFSEILKIKPWPHITFEPFNNFSFSKWLFFSIYCFTQEFLARGVMQTSLQKFFADGYKTIFINAFFLSLCLMPLGYQIAINTFLIGISMGFLYFKQESLIGVFLAHLLLLGLGLVNI